MNGLVKITMVTMFALTASACGQKEETAARMDADVEEAKKTLEERSVDAADQVADDEIGQVGADVMENAGDMGDQAMDAAKDAMNAVDGEVGNVVEQVEDMASDAMEEVKDMSAEDLRKKAMEKAGGEN